MGWATIPDNQWLHSNQIRIESDLQQSFTPLITFSSPQFCSNLPKPPQTPCSIHLEGRGSYLPVRELVLLPLQLSGRICPNQFYFLPLHSLPCPPLSHHFVPQTCAVWSIFFQFKFLTNLLIPSSSSIHQFISSISALWLLASNFVWGFIIQFHIFEGLFPHRVLFLIFSLQFLCLRGV